MDSFSDKSTADYFHTGHDGTHGEPATAHGAQWADGNAQNCHRPLNHPTTIQRIEQRHMLAEEISLLRDQRQRCADSADVYGQRIVNGIDVTDSHHWRVELLAVVIAKLDAAIERAEKRAEENK